MFPEMTPSALFEMRSKLKAGFFQQLEKILFGMRIGNAAHELAFAIEDYRERDTLPVSIDAKKLVYFAVRIEQRRIRDPVLRNE